jgi:hypothetical protein
MMNRNWAAIEAVISNEAKCYPIKHHSATNMNNILGDLSDGCKKNSFSFQ